MPPTSSESDAPRYRPLGISVALLATTLFYGLYPLVFAYPALWSAVTGRGELFGFEFMGGNWGLVGLGLAVPILVATVFAWRGRPSGVRLLYIGLVWAAAAAQLARQIPALNPPSPNAPFSGSNIELPASFYVCLTIFNFLIPLYVTWYLNRAPARAFYGGDNKS